MEPTAIIDPTDGQLLAKFILNYDEMAFETLVKRYTPVVMGVCYRLLENQHDAEEAFQSTFLTLSQKAVSIRKKESVGAWIYRVAFRTALELRSKIISRRKHADHVKEELMVDLQSFSDESPPEDLWEKVGPVLDEELNQLPKKYRTPIILCYIKGKTSEEAARELGLTEVLTRKRLERARNRLRSRFAERGVAIPGALLATLLIGKASAAVPNEFIASTVKAITSFNAATSTGTIVTGTVPAQVVALTQNVIKAMFMERLKAGVMTFLAIVGITGGGVLIAQQISKTIDQKSSISSVAQLSILSPKATVQEQNMDQALYDAIFTSDVTRVKNLLSKGASPNTLLNTKANQITDIQPSRTSALLMAVLRGELEIVKTLLENGADVNIKTPEFDVTPLKIAVLSGNTEIVKVLLAHGADVNVLKTRNPADDLMTRIQIIRKQGKTEIADLLEQAMTAPKGFSEPNKTEK